MKALCEKSLSATILRPAAIYGIRSEYGLYNVIKQVYKDRNRKKMLMVGKGSRTEAFLHVEDMCRASIHAYDNDSMIGEAYNVSDDSRITTADFFRLVCREILGTEKDLFHVPISVLVPVALVSQFIARLFRSKPLFERATLQYLTFDKIWDNSKLKGTGFVFKYPTMEQGMKETIAWYRRNGWFKA
jgi:nucleoside-diphosphate-sugar epimerase